MVNSTQDQFMDALLLLFARLLLLHIVGAFIVEYADFFLLKSSFFTEDTHGRTSEHGLKVIACGFPRSGTWSLKLALDRLGFRCYHGSNILNPSHAKLWLEAAASGKLDNRYLLDVLEGYTAIIDLPATCFYKQLMAAYPDAKVILNIRDPDKWYGSFHRTLYWARNLLLRRMFATTVWKLIEMTLFQGKFDGRFEEKSLAIGVYKEHMEEVKRCVSKEKLLVYDVKEGWGSLCDFLQVEIPQDMSFPVANDTANFQRFVHAILHVHQVVLAFYLVILFSTIVLLGKWLCTLWFSH